MQHQTSRGYESDVLRIGDDLLPDISPELDKLLQQGLTQRTKILDGTESAPSTKEVYANTSVKITFSNERDLRQCVRLLRWSDERLRARPDQRILWNWSTSFRLGMTISFGVRWHDKDFFEARKDVFRNTEHSGYYAMFGASADQFEIEHQVLK